MLDLIDVESLLIVTIIRWTVGVFVDIIVLVEISLLCHIPIRML